jgi:plastocyanin
MGMKTTLTVRADAPLVDPDPVATTPGSVRIVQFAFVAPNLDVPVGTTVTWSNDDPAPHTVTADGAAFDSKQLDPGATFSTVLDTPGSFAYHCEIHPTMVGTVVVH